MPPSFARPPRQEVQRARALFLPLRALFSPVFIDLDKAPATGPRLFVGNHSLLGGLDVPHLFWELVEQRDIWLRGLGDHAHWNVPVWRELMDRWGVVDGTPENCARLLHAGEPVLVFPGGSREVAKRRGEQYELIWKQRTGFARMAMEHGATIVPFAALGADDAWDIVADAEDMQASAAGQWVRRIVDSVGLPADAVPPIVRGIGPTPIPRPVRLYFAIGDPIDTRGRTELADDAAARWALREETRTAIEALLFKLQRVREGDPHADFARRATRGVLERFGHLLKPSHKR